MYPSSMKLYSIKVLLCNNKLKLTCMLVLWYNYNYKLDNRKKFQF